MIELEYKKDKNFYYKIGGVYVITLILFLISGFLPYYSTCTTGWGLPCKNWYSINGFLSMTINVVSYSGIIGLLFVFISNCFIFSLKIKIAKTLGIIGCILLVIYLINLLIRINTHSLPGLYDVYFFHKIEFGFTIGLITLFVIYGINISLLILSIISSKSEKTKMDSNKQI